MELDVKILEFLLEHFRDFFEKRESAFSFSVFLTSSESQSLDIEFVKKKTII